MSWFEVNKTSGQLRLSRAVQLDAMPTVFLHLVVKATDDCWSGYWYRHHVTWTAHDASLLLVRVAVVMATRFTKTTFVAGITLQAQAGHDVIRLAVAGLLINRSTSSYWHTSLTHSIV